MKSVVNTVDLILNKQSLISLEEAKSIILPSYSGFYWIYTKLKLSTFINAPKPINEKHIDISQLSKVHKDLQSVNSQNNNEYWCIYNGKGKQLKDRIAAEFTNTKGKTGKLALNRCFKSSDFKIKYIVCGASDIDNGIKTSYDNLQRDFERSWRLNNKWPLLCRV